MPRVTMQDIWTKLIDNGWKPRNSYLLIKKIGKRDSSLQVNITFQHNNEIWLDDHQNNKNKKLKYDDFSGKNISEIIEEIENIARTWVAENHTKQEKLKADKAIKIGDIFVSTWGYEQTNVNFYQVIKATAKTVIVREIRRKREDGGAWGQYKAMPKKDDFRSEPMRRRVDHSSDRPSIRIDYHFARLWDGKPVNGTDYA